MQKFRRNARQQPLKMAGMSTAPNPELSLPAIVAAVVQELASVRAADPESLLSPRDAEKFLGISLRSLQDRADIPRINMSPLGSKRMMWRYRRSDLIEYAARRTIQPFPRETSA